MKKTKNAGFSLVELIVVIAIMGVLVGMSAMGISFMFSRDAEKCATEIEGGLDKLRTYTMSKKGEWYMEIKEDASGDWLMTIYRNLNDGNGDVIYEQMNLGSRNTLTPSSIRIQFNRVSGGVARIDDTGTGWRNPTEGEVVVIEVDSNRTNKVKKVNLVTLTGKHYIDQ